MVKYEKGSLDVVFQALSDPTRREMVRLLSQRTANVGGLASHFSVSLPAVSKHLKVLERAGIIDRERQGRIHRISLNASPLKDAEAWISQYQQFWEVSLDRLEAYLSNTKPQEGG